MDKLESHLQEVIDGSQTESWQLEIPMGKRVLLQLIVLRLNRALPSFWEKNVSEIVEVLEAHPRLKAHIEKADANDLAFTIREFKFTHAAVS